MDKNSGRMSMGRFLRLYALYAKMDFNWLTRDRTFALIAIAGDVLSNISAVTGVFLLAYSFGGIGGMSEYEVLLMLGYTTMVTGIFQVFFSGNNAHISRRIGRGQLDHMMIQPLPMPVQLLTDGFIPFSGSSNLITGSIIITVAVNKLGITLPWWWIFSLIANLIVTIVIIVASSYIASTVTFYMPVQAEEISTFIIDTQGQISEYPLSGMPLALQLPLLTIIPSGLLGWFPTLALLGKAPLGLPFYYPLIIALILSVAAAILFRKGLRYYAKIGINRYLAYGHRR